jgi:hypothetical protein
MATDIIMEAIVMIRAKKTKKHTTIKEFIVDHEAPVYPPDARKLGLLGPR